MFRDKEIFHVKNHKGENESMQEQTRTPVFQNSDGTWGHLTKTINPLTGSKKSWPLDVLPSLGQMKRMLKIVGIIFSDHCAYRSNIIDLVFSKPAVVDDYIKFRQAVRLKQSILLC